MGIVMVAALRRQRDLWASNRGDHVDPLANQLGR
jgi:hypothetical protein